MGLLFRVCQQVHPDVPLLGEADPTLRAHVGPFTHVSLDVHLEVGRVVKFCATLWTHKLRFGLEARHDCGECSINCVD